MNHQDVGLQCLKRESVRVKERRTDEEELDTFEMISGPKSNGIERVSHRVSLEGKDVIGGSPKTLDPSYVKGASKSKEGGQQAPQDP